MKLSVFDNKPLDDDDNKIGQCNQQTQIIVQWRETWEWEVPYTTNNNHNHDIDHSPSPSHVQNHHDGISPGPGRHGINHTFAISLHFQFFIFFCINLFQG